VKILELSTTICISSLSIIGSQYDSLSEWSDRDENRNSTLTFNSPPSVLWTYRKVR
jgi:hypothetical protein